MLRRPHLMLVDLGGDDRVHAARRVEQRLHRALRHDVGARLLLFGEVEAARRAPAVDAAPPFAKVARLVALCLPAGDDRIERAAGVADHREVDGHDLVDRAAVRSGEHTSELQSLMRISYAVFCLKKKHKHNAYYDSNS